MAPSITDRPQMDDYGVPDDLDGVLPWSWAEQRLVESWNYWVVTASRAARPHAMPVWGVWRPDHDEYWFSCATEARKARNLRENPAITITAQDTVEVVSVEGTAELITDTERQAPVIDAYVDKYAEPGNADELRGIFLDTSCFCVTPERAFGIIETAEEFGPRATRWRWT